MFDPMCALVPLQVSELLVIISRWAVTYKESHAMDC